MPRRAARTHRPGTSRRRRRRRSARRRAQKRVVVVQLARQARGPDRRAAPSSENWARCTRAASRSCADFRASSARRNGATAVLESPAAAGRRPSKAVSPDAAVRDGGTSATPPARQRLRDWVCFRAGRRVEVGLFQNPAATAMSRGGASVPRRLPAWGRRPLQAGREEPPDRRRRPRPRSASTPCSWWTKLTETQLKSPSSRTSSCICSR